MTAIDMTGHTTNLTTSTKIVVNHGVLATGEPLLFGLLMDVYSDTPAMTTGRGTKTWPTFLSDAVSQAVNMPPSVVSLKKARCKAGTSPMTAPSTAPRRGAFR